VRWSNGVPLGGIGCGKIELLTDGSFANATIYNNWDTRTGFLKGCFFAVCCDDGTTKVARMLRLAPNCADSNIADVERIHKQRLGLPDYSEYEAVENIAGTEYIGSFPFATIRFEDSALPIRITLDAFSPLIPHDIENSSLPVAFLTFTLDNRTEKTVRASLLVSWEDILVAADSSQEKWRLLRDCRLSLRKMSGLCGLVFRKLSRDTNPPIYTDYFFIGSNEVDDTIMGKIFADYFDPQLVKPWDRFRSSGRNDISISFMERDSWAQSDDFIVRKILEPGQKVAIHFILAWRSKDCITTYIKKTPTSQLVDSDSGTTAVWDQNPATIWSTGRPMRSGDAFEVDLGNPQTVSRIILKSRRAPQEYPRGCAILFSPDGLNWTTVLSLDQRMCYMRQREGEIEFNLSNITTRFLKMRVLNSSSDRPWSMEEIQIEGPDGWQIKPVAARSRLVALQEEKIQENISHYYESRFSDLSDIVKYSFDRREEWMRRSREVPDLINKSNLPPWLKQQLINSAFTMFSNTVFTKDGRFATQESPVSMKGALSTSDQRLAAHAYLTMFFPELDKRELNLFARCQDLVEPVADGRIPHFTGNINEIIGNPNVTSGVRDWPDLSCSYVMQVLKFYRWTGDHSFLQEHWQHVKRAMDWLESADFDGDAIPEGGSSFDYEPSGFGSSSYTAICYLGALKAAEEMARVVGDSVKQKQFRNRFHAVQESAMKSLWNGKYFIKRYDPRTGKKNTDCFIAQLAGDWMSQLSGLGATIPDDMRLTAVSEIIRRNVHYPSFALPPMEVSEDGTSATKSCYILQQEPYVAMEAIYAGFVDEGLALMKRIHDNTWSTNHNPWNECLWVDARTGMRKGLVSYMTSPACWHILNALSGATLNLPDETLYLAPRLPSNMKELHIPLFFPTFWAHLDYLPAEKKLTLEIIRVWDGSRGAISRIIGRKSPDPIPLKKKFLIRKNETLDLSELFEQL
jgi:uncharacterized protein (DUF608 family)